MSNFNSRSFTIEGDDGDIQLDILNDDKDVTLKDAIIDLYLNVKIRNSEDIDNYNEDKLKEERDQLRDVDPFSIIEYIKSSIEILLSLKLEEQEKEFKKDGGKQTVKKKEIPISNFKSNTSSIVDFFSDQSSCRIEPPQEYETQLQKLEADVRNHIRIEQQLKIHLDNVLQKLEDQEKLQGVEQIENQERIKELKKDKERLEELLSLREKEIGDLKIKYENYDTNLIKEKQELEIKLASLEKEYNTKLQTLQKEIEDHKLRIKTLSEKRSSQIQNFIVPENEEKEDYTQLKKKFNESNELFNLQEILENSTNKSSKKNRNLSRGGAHMGATMSFTNNPATYVLSSTGSTNNLHQNDLAKFKSMKEMLKMKNDHIKLYKDSFQNAKAKSRSPSKYQSQDNNQPTLMTSNSQGNLHGSNIQNHKRSQSHNMTASNIKPSTAAIYDGQQQQKNLIQQYNNYIQLKQGNSRTTGQMSLNMTQSVNLTTGQSTENYKHLLPADEFSEHNVHGGAANLYQPSYVNLYLGPQNSNQLSGHHRNNSSGFTVNKKLVSKQHQTYSMALNSSGNNTGRGATTSIQNTVQKTKNNKTSYSDVSKQLSQTQSMTKYNNTTAQNIPTKQYQQQQQQQVMVQSQSQYIKPMIQQQPSMVVLSSAGSNQHIQSLNPIINNKNSLQKKKILENAQSLIGNLTQMGQTQANGFKHQQ